MKKYTVIKETELLLREYKIMKAIANNPNLSQDKQILASNKVADIDLALTILSVQELKIITMRYIDGFTNVKISKKLKYTPEHLCSKTKGIVVKLSRCLAL